MDDINLKYSFIVRQEHIDRYHINEYIKNKSLLENSKSQSITITESLGSIADSAIKQVSTAPRVGKGFLKVAHQLLDNSIPNKSEFYVSLLPQHNYTLEGLIQMIPTSRH